ncbi:lipopolysaccharide core biosynthesis protein rfaS [Flavobacterium sp. WV_118_3]|uniref:lipopolysaccharide core biosynthesis protein rfaS n=1 Tax=Flavobacterium sp. WV_118_3 TaxID=3151764 RepID=UPI0032193E50
MNIKTIPSQNVILQKINQYATYDIVYANRHDMRSPKLLTLITNKARLSIVHYWDSLTKIKGQKETIPYFDSHYSFDKNDRVPYGLHFTTNFYFIDNFSQKPKYEVLFPGTYDHRFPKIKQIIQQLSNQGINVNALLFPKDKNIRKQYASTNTSFPDKITPFPEIVAYSGNTPIILDIHHPNQSGLSFRPFEAIGLKKKLITTNPDIQTYDFYDPNNIFIWTDTTLSVPDSFFSTPYTEIPLTIQQKYTLENWVHSVLTIKSNSL